MRARHRNLLCAGLFLALNLLVAGTWLAACGDEPASPNPLGDAGADASDVGDAGPDAADASDGNTCVLFDASTLDPAGVAYGLVLLQSHKCTSCHGDTLSGNDDGVTAPEDEGGTAYPPNLTPDPATGLGCWTQAQIVRAILDGLDNMDQPLCPPMPVFSDAGTLTLTPVEALAVAEYLQSLPVIVNNVPNTNCPAGVTLPDAGSDAGPDASATADAGSDGSAVDAADDGDTGDSGLADDSGDAAGE